HILAGVLLGLAVSANMATAFPALALFISTLVVEEGGTKTRLQSFAAQLIPCAAVFASICYAPLLTAERSHFYVGTTTIFDSLFSLIYSSVSSVVAPPGLFGTGADAHILVVFVSPVIVVLILWTARFAIRAHRQVQFLLIALSVAIAGVAAA